MTLFERGMCHHVDDVAVGVLECSGSRAGQMQNLSVVVHILGAFFADPVLGEGHFFIRAVASRDGKDTREGGEGHDGEEQSRLHAVELEDDDDER